MLLQDICERDFQTKNRVRNDHINNCLLRHTICLVFTTTGTVTVYSDVTVPLPGYGGGRSELIGDGPEINPQKRVAIRKCIKSIEKLRFTNFLLNHFNILHRKYTKDRWSC